MFSQEALVGVKAGMLGQPSLDVGVGGRAVDVPDQVQL